MTYVRIRAGNSNHRSHHPVDLQSYQYGWSVPVSFSCPRRTFRYVCVQHVAAFNSPRRRSRPFPILHGPFKRFEAIIAIEVINVCKSAILTRNTIASWLGAVVGQYVVCRTGT